MSQYKNHSVETNKNIELGLGYAKKKKNNLIIAIICLLIVISATSCEIPIEKINEPDTHIEYNSSEANTSEQTNPAENSSPEKEVVPQEKTLTDETRIQINSLLRVFVKEFLTSFESPTDDVLIAFGLNYTMHTSESLLEEIDCFVDPDDPDFYNSRIQSNHVENAIKKYFGIDFSSSNATHTGSYWEYRSDGYYYLGITDSETTDWGIPIVESFDFIGNNKYKLVFRTYEDTSWSHDQSDYYSYTIEQATSDQDLKLIDIGTAIIEDTVIDGESTFVLIQYLYPDIADLPEWKKLYIDHVNNNFLDDPTCANYALVYIDDDDIPELFVDYGFTYAGAEICTISNGEVKAMNKGLFDLNYIKHGNLFSISGGRQGVYFDYIYTIKDGEFTILHDGEYGDLDNSNPQIDSEGNLIYQYSWDKMKVSENEYKASLTAVFKNSKTLNGYDNTFSFDEIINAIKVF